MFEDVEIVVWSPYTYNIIFFFFKLRVPKQPLSMIQDWKRKVVVEHTDFKVGGYKIRDVPIQSDRTKDILKSEPKKIALKMLYDRESHTG